MPYTVNIQLSEPQVVALDQLRGGHTRRAAVLRLLDASLGSRPGQLAASPLPALREASGAIVGVFGQDFVDAFAAQAEPARLGKIGAMFPGVKR